MPLVLGVRRLSVTIHSPNLLVPFLGSTMQCISVWVIPPLYDGMFLLGVCCRIVERIGLRGRPLY